MLAIYHRVIIGISFDKDRMAFRPVIPESFRGPYSLDNFSYRGGTYNIKVKGWGDTIESFRIDGAESAGHFIPDTLTGNHTVEITMNGKANRNTFNLSANLTAPETPVLSVKDKGLVWSPVSEATGYRVFKNGKMVAATTETELIPDRRSEAGEYQVMAVSGSGTESFLSNPVTVSPSNVSTVTAEAESFNISGEDVYPGFTGSGYVRFTLEKNRELIVVLKATSGIYALQMRYANGSGPVNTDNNCAIRSLYVNGEYVNALVFPQRGKEEWSDWGYTFPEWIELREGENILTIRYENFNMNMDGEINEFILDRITLERFD